MEEDENKPGEDQHMSEDQQLFGRFAANNVSVDQGVGRHHGSLQSSKSDIRSKKDGAKSRTCHGSNQRLGL